MRGGQIPDGFTIRTPTVKGTRSSAEVPDTLDLAERARCAVNVLTRAVVPQRSYAVWHEMRFDPNPPYFRWANWLTYKWLEALPRMRAMSGSEQNLDVERSMMEAFLERIGPHGLLYYPAMSPDQPPETAYAVGCARMILAMAAWHEREPDPVWPLLIGNMARGLDRMAVRRFHYAYFPLESGYSTDGSWSFTRRGGGRAEFFPYTPPDEPAREQQGHEGTVKFEAGTAIRALVRAYRLTGDETSLDLARKLGAFLTLPSLWENSWPHGAPDHEHGIWAGHFHGNTMPLRGLLDLAAATGDGKLSWLVHEAYEHACSAGLRRVGWYPGWIHPERFGRVRESKAVCESCALGNMIALAIGLTDAGLGDYWDDVDAIVRNHLAEQQFVDLPRMKAVAEWAQANKPREKVVTDLSDPWASDVEDVVERTWGGFGMAGLTHANPAASYSCCVANGALGLYDAWEGAVRGSGNSATVNLLLNRASSWLDVDSFLPYEGKVRITTHAARTVSTRIPSWIRIERVAASLDGRAVSPRRTGRYLVLDGLKPGQRIELRFDVPEEQCSYTAYDEAFSFRFRGSTVVGVTPARTEPGLYRFYDRDNMRTAKAPSKRVERFVAEGGA
jgi:hypothetical protein